MDGKHYLWYSLRDKLCYFRIDLLVFREAHLSQHFTIKFCQEPSNRPGNGHDANLTNGKNAKSGYLTLTVSGPSICSISRKSAGDGLML